MGVVVGMEIGTRLVRGGGGGTEELFILSDLLVLLINFSSGLFPFDIGDWNGVLVPDLVTDVRIKVLLEEDKEDRIGEYTASCEFFEFDDPGLVRGTSLREHADVVDSLLLVIDVSKDFEELLGERLVVIEPVGSVGFGSPCIRDCRSPSSCGIGGGHELTRKEDSTFGQTETILEEHEMSVQSLKEWFRVGLGSIELGWIIDSSWIGGLCISSIILHWQLL